MQFHSNDKFSPGRFSFAGKAFEALKRALGRKRRAFEKLTKAQKRVAIARDVIQQIQSRKLYAMSCYLDINHKIFRPRAAGLDMSLATSQLSCGVCGIGSLFVAAVENADKLKIKDFSFGDTRAAEVRYLTRWFDEKQLDLVEQYFERKCGHEFRDLPIICQGDHAITSELDADKRLIMIMENIVSNRGTFRPEKGRHSALDKRAGQTDHELEAVEED